MQGKLLFIYTELNTNKSQEYIETQNKKIRTIKSNFNLEFQIKMIELNIE